MHYIPGTVDPRTDLEPCEWTHCINAPHADNDTRRTYLVYSGADYNYTETEVNFGSTVEYHCFNGMKNDVDFNYGAQTATCNTGNVWSAPTDWKNCTDST